MRKIIVYHQMRSWTKNTSANTSSFINRYNSIRTRSYNFLEPQRNTILTLFYELILFAAIVIAVVPLMIIDGNSVKDVEFIRKIGVFASTIFLFELFVRWTFADKTLDNGKKSFFLYFFSANTLIDLFAILPTFLIGNSVFLSLRIIRQLKIFKSTPGYKLLVNGIKREKKTLRMLFALLVSVILIGALLIYNVEGPNVSDSVNWNRQIVDFSDAIWLVFVTLTTIGFGDITPQSDIGQVIIGIVSIVSLVTTALLTGVVLMGFTQEIEYQKNMENKKEFLAKEYIMLNQKLVANINDDQKRGLILKQKDIKKQVKELDESSRHIKEEDHITELDEELKKLFSNKHHKIFDLKYDIQQFKEKIFEKKELRKSKKEIYQKEKEKYKHYKKTKK